MSYGSIPTSKTGADTGTAVITGSGELCGVNFVAGAAADTFILYDSATAASGTVLFNCVNSKSETLPRVIFKVGVYRVQTEASGSTTSTIYTSRV